MKTCGYSYNLMLKKTPYHIIPEQKSAPIPAVIPILILIGSYPARVGESNKIHNGSKVDCLKHRVPTHIPYDGGSKLWTVQNLLGT